MTEKQKIESIRNSHGRNFKLYLKDNLTRTMAFTAVECDGTLLPYVPEEYQDYDLWLYACKSNGEALRYISEGKRSLELCAAVSTNGQAIEYVPKDFLSSAICLTAASQDPSVFSLIPEEYITTEFVVKVVEGYGSKAVSFLPPQYKKPQFVAPVIERVPDIIWYLPKNCHTSAICKIAIKAMGFASVGDAVKDNPYILSQLHTSLYDHDSSLIFVSTDWFSKLCFTDIHSISSAKKGRLTYSCQAIWIKFILLNTYFDGKMFARSL